MQLPPLISEYVTWMRAHRRELIRYGSVVGGLAVAALVVWLVPPLRQQAQTAWAKAVPPVADVYDAAAPAAQAATLADSVAGLKERVGQLEQSLADQKKSIDQLSRTVQAAQEATKSSLAGLSQDISRARQAVATSDVKDESEVEGSGSLSTASPAASGPLNLNAATADQLDGLPGIGPAYAKRIVDYREQKGDFTSVDDLDKVSGIGAATIEKIRSLVTV